MTEVTAGEWSGVYGLHSARWADVRKALRRLGAQPHRTTTGHNSVLLVMPTGTKIAVGKPQDAMNQVMGSALRQVLDEVRRSGLEPMLFLAVLDTIGAAWNTKPAVVSQLSQYLRHSGATLTRQRDWKATLARFRRETSMSTTTTSATPQDDTPTTAEEARPVESKRERRSFDYDTSKVVELAKVDPQQRRNASTWLSSMMNKGQGAAGQLIVAGEARRERSEPGGRFRNVFTEHAALTMAEELESRFGLTHPPEEETPVPETPVPETPVPETPVPVVAAADPVEAAAQRDQDRRAQRAWDLRAAAREARVAREDVLPGVGFAVARLCRYFDVMPRFSVASPLTIDLSETILALDEAMRQDEEDGDA